VLGPFGKHDALGPFSTHDTYDVAPIFSKDEYKAGLRELVDWATNTVGASRVILALPIPFPFGSALHTTSTLVLPATLEVAAELRLQTVDLNAPFAGASVRRRPKTIPQSPSSRGRLQEERMRSQTPTICRTQKLT
jgi:hypothetical protein